MKTDSRVNYGRSLTNGAGPTRCCEPAACDARHSSDRGGEGRGFQAVAGCNCDRWGHPCPGCVERNRQPKAELPISSPVKQ